MSWLTRWRRSNAARSTDAAVIMTPSGEVAVERLRPGHPVSTADGAIKPVLWLGRQTVAARFVDPLRVNPTCIFAGALAKDVPSRDLRVSPAHALLVGGVLVQAGALVNGTTVIREAPLSTCFLVRLDAHQPLLANGAPAETFVDTTEPARVDNAAERPGGPPMPVMPLPRARLHRQVPQCLRWLLTELRAALAGPDATARIAWRWHRLRTSPPSGSGPGEALGIRAPRP